MTTTQILRASAEKGSKEDCVNVGITNICSLTVISLFVHDRGHYCRQCALRHELSCVYSFYLNYSEIIWFIFNLQDFKAFNTWTKREALASAKIVKYNHINQWVLINQMTTVYPL